MYAIRSYYAAEPGRHEDPGADRGDEGHQAANEPDRPAEHPQQGRGRERPEQEDEPAQYVVVGIGATEPLEPLVAVPALREDLTGRLYASFSMAVVIAFAGGRPGMISAATGAMALVMVTLVKEHGLQYLLAVV